MKLTDADRKWMLTAEYGGTGGKPIEGGMVVEEPDIEIGAGVSSKGRVSVPISKQSSLTCTCSNLETNADRPLRATWPAVKS